MSTGDNLINQFHPMVSSSCNPHPIRSSRIMKRKTARKNHSQIHFRFGGNRKDPLNLNGLIQKKKKELAQVSATNANAADNGTSNNHGNDRPVEILLQPDIFDPLRLDPSSRNDGDLNNISSIPSTSTDQSYPVNPKVKPIRQKRFLKKRRHTQPPRYGNFQGYYGYRQPSQDQRLQYLQDDWFRDKQVLDIGCHTGHVTFYVAEQFHPRDIVGLDIDQRLVQQARHQLWNRRQSINPLPSHITNDHDKHYPFNLRFEQGYLHEFGN